MTTVQRKPVIVLILAALTFAIIMPPLAEYFARDPLEVSFAYPRSDRPQVNIENFIVITIFLVIVQFVTFFGAIIAGIAILKKQRWACHLAG